MEQKPIAPDAVTSNTGTSQAGNPNPAASDTATRDGTTSGRTTLSRATGTGMVGGVCAGLADYFDVDPVLVRAVFVAGAFMSGFSLVLYLVLWIALDDADRQPIDGPVDAVSPPDPTVVPYPADTDVR